jgi:hypothetical protein
MKLEPPLDLSKWLKGERKVRNRIYRVGIELEGAWSKLPRGVRLQRDGSLDPLQRRLMENEATQAYLVGELPSPPLELSQWETWVQTFHPHKVSPECGLHIHMSFPTAFTYQRVMRPNFPSTILNYVQKWAEEQKLPKDHPLWPRLEGKSRYCQHKFFADAQVATPSKDFNQEREGHRYTVINYPFTRNQTCECRLLTMFDTPEQSISALREVITITNAYLVATAAREPKVQKRFILDGAEVRTARNGVTVTDSPTSFREVRHVRA